MEGVQNSNKKNVSLVGFNEIIIIYPFFIRKKLCESWGWNCNHKNRKWPIERLGRSFKNKSLQKGACSHWVLIKKIKNINNKRFLASKFFNKIKKFHPKFLQKFITKNLSLPFVQINWALRSTQDVGTYKKISPQQRALIGAGCLIQPWSLLW